MMLPLMLGGIALGAAIGRGGPGAVVALAIFAAIFLLDAVLTPWIHYRRARRDHDAPHR